MCGWGCYSASLANEISSFLQHAWSLEMLEFEACDFRA